MKDRTKLELQLMTENEELRRRVQELEAADAECLHSDVTEQKQAEEELARSKAMLSATIDCLPFEVFAIAEDGRYVLQNALSRANWGRLVGKTPQELAATEAAGAHPVNNNRRVYAGEKVEEMATVTLRGEHCVITPIRDETGCYGVMGVNVDITQRKRIEEALTKANDELEQRVKERTAELTKANEELTIYRKFAESSAEGFSMADLEGRLTYLNPALCRILGEERPEERIGQHFSLYYSEESNRRGREEIQPALMREGYWQGELPMLSRQGKCIPTWHNSFLIRDDSGNPLRLGVVITDITERKQAQAALERERRTLEHMLRASDHERQLIAYDIHDGLAQELAGAIMQFQIYDHQKDTQPEEAKKAFEGGVTLLRQGHFEARRLISGVRPPILDESGVVAAIAHLVHDPAFGQGPKIDFCSRVTFNRLAPVVENVIYRIVQEGLTNARYHSKSKKIVVHLAQRNGHLRIEIRDWGIGFDARTNQENRFGLEGIRERARLLGGKCRIRSKIGVGTLILVELPIVQRAGEK